MFAPNGNRSSKIHAAPVKTGIRLIWVFTFASLGASVLLGAADAGRAGEYRCTGDPSRPESDLRFETIDLRTAKEQTPEFIAGGRLVKFQWNAATGELSFTTGAAVSPVTLPEDFVRVAAKTALTSCESR